MVTRKGNLLEIFDLAGDLIEKSLAEAAGLVEEGPAGSHGPFFVAAVRAADRMASHGHQPSIDLLAAALKSAIALVESGNASSDPDLVVASLEVASARWKPPPQVIG